MGMNLKLECFIHAFDECWGIHLESLQSVQIYTHTSAVRVFQNFNSAVMKELKVKVKIWLILMEMAFPCDCWEMYNPFVLSLAHGRGISWIVSRVNNFHSLTPDLCSFSEHNSMITFSGTHSCMMLTPVGLTPVLWSLPVWLIPVQ